VQLGVGLQTNKGSEYMSSKVLKREARDGMIKKAMGRPRRWLTEEAFQKEFMAYIEMCLGAEPKRIPNIAGFCIFADIIREIYYKQEQIYPESYAKTRLCLEDQTINLKDTIRSIFLLKSVFNYRDSDAPASMLTVNYNNIADNQLQSWLKDAKLIQAPNDDDED